jgi:hypothetical protein
LALLPAAAQLAPLLQAQGLLLLALPSPGHQGSAAASRALLLLQGPALGLPQRPALLLLLLLVWPLLRLPLGACPMSLDACQCHQLLLWARLLLLQLLPPLAVHLLAELPAAPPAAAVLLARLLSC